MTALSQYKSRIYSINTVVLLVLALSFSFSVAAQGQKPKSDSASKPKICGGGVINSKVLVDTKAVYSRAAKEARAQGQVIVMVRVNETGMVFEATACTGHKLLRQAAVDAALKMQLPPTVVSNEAVKVGGILIFVFKLKNGEGRLVDTKRRQTSQWTGTKQMLDKSISLFVHGRAWRSRPHGNSAVIDFEIATSFQ
jgi:hypothetical protein